MSEAILDIYENVFTQHMQKLVQLTGVRMVCNMEFHLVP